jgi:hypothetical protein
LFATWAEGEMAEVGLSPFAQIALPVLRAARQIVSFQRYGGGTEFPKDAA